MPLHDYRCFACGRVEEQFTPLSELRSTVRCSCGQAMERVFLVAPQMFISADICYDSPVDGTPVTSKQKRIEDLARNGCIPYEPGMRQDAERRRVEQERALERAIDSTVEETVSKWPARKREKLAAELESGISADVVRV